MATVEFNKYKSDPKLNAEMLPDGSLAFEDGGGYMVIGPNFVSVGDSEEFAYGDTREEAIANYQELIPTINADPPASIQADVPPALIPADPILET